MVERALQPGIEIGVVGLGEAIGTALLAAKELYNLHARNHLLQRGRETGETRPGDPVGTKGPLLQPDNGDKTQRQRRTGQQAQLDVHIKDITENCENREDIAEHRDHAVGKKLVERVDVAGIVRH